MVQPSLASMITLLFLQIDSINCNFSNTSFSFNLIFKILTFANFCRTVFVFSKLNIGTVIAVVNFDGILCFCKKEVLFILQFRSVCADEIAF